MWLIVLSLAAVASTLVWYFADREGKYGTGMLSLIFWGTSLMVLVDHIIGYLAEGGEFLDISASSALLSLTMVLTGLLIWVAYLLLKDPAGRLRGLSH